MTTISASLVKELRERTGLGLMECKRALEESSGEIELAITNLRKASVLKAEKKSSRTTLEGKVFVESLEDKNQVILIEINCETDFVAKDKNFLKFCREVVEFAKKFLNEKGIDYVLQGTEDSRKSLVQKVGENIVVRKIESLTGKVVNSYVHTNDRIASAVSLSEGNKEVAKDIAMHIAALNPKVLNPEDLSEDFIKKEREIILSQISEEEKPPEILEKMLDGRLKKLISEVSLLKQDFVKDPSKNVETFLEETNSKVDKFVRIEVGEGIDVEKVDFAQEVMSQITK